MVLVKMQVQKSTILTLSTLSPFTPRHPCLITSFKTGHPGEKVSLLNPNFSSFGHLY